MFGAFAEAVRATAQPCSFLLVVPITLIVLTTGARRCVTAAAVVGAVAGGWLLTANWFVLDGVWLRLSAVCAMGALATITWASHERFSEGAADGPIFAWAVAALAVISTMWWRPCVGHELGAILTNSQSGLAHQLPGMTAYMFGTMVPVVATALVVEVVAPSARQRLWIGSSAGALGIVVSGALALGHHHLLVRSLTLWTSG
ncbi:MAG: hypothetical protein GY925_04175 [Actinomycetia bacterium]|nr:hypothetical protein [Actinomycetes bacterium]